MTERHKGLEVIYCADKRAFNKWLNQNHGQEESIWLKLAKKGSQQKSPSYEEARETAIAWGWIDGLVNALNDSFYLIKFSLRRKKSKWSKINRGIAEGLIEKNKMRKSGLAQVEAAKADGRWQAAYDSPSQMKEPADFLAALKKNKKAREFYPTISKANRNTMLYQIQDAKKEETRQRRINKFITMLAEGRASQ